MKMRIEDYHFLSERISEPNTETDFFFLNPDPHFSMVPDAIDLKRDQLLLRFKQRIWEIPEHYFESDLVPFYSAYYDDKVDNVPLLMHDMIYRDQFSTTKPLETYFSCKPTLSFRTLIFDEVNHVKFGLPLLFGRMIRQNRRDEVLRALYISDYVQSIPPIEKLDFFQEIKGYCLRGLENYCVSYRRIEGQDELVPISCYFNKVLNHSPGNAGERLARSLAFFSEFLIDFEVIYKALKINGLGLEIHGQNLLVKLNKDGTAKRGYVYRDFGDCTIDQKIQRKLTDLNRFYKSRYGYKFEKDKCADPGYFAWRNYRRFFLGFFLYNLDLFTRENKIEINAYEWFDGVIKNLPMIRSIY